MKKVLHFCKLIASLICLSVICYCSFILSTGNNGEKPKEISVVIIYPQIEHSSTVMQHASYTRLEEEIKINYFGDTSENSHSSDRLACCD